MAKRLQHRGGTTAQHSTFTGAVREVTVDTDKDTLVVHDGATAGGKPLPTLSGTETLSNKTLASPVATGTVDINGNLDVDGGTIKLDGNYPVGTANVALGDTALDSVTSGGYNTAIGNLSLTAITTGGNNTGLGHNSLGSSATGNDNTALGFAGLFSTTSGSSNTAVGGRALQCNTTASNNTAVGFCSLYFNTTGGANTSLGHNSLNANTTGGANTAVGQCALKGNTVGAGNTALGWESMCNASSTSSYNTALGYDTMKNIAGGSFNVAIGRQAMLNSTTTRCSIGIGYRALCGNTTGCINTGIGYFSLASVTSGCQNTALGSSSGSSVTSGSNLTLLGYNAQPSSATATNEITLGDANISASNIRAGDGYTLSNTPAFSAYRNTTTAQVIPDATYTVGELQATFFDTDSAFDTSTYRFTVPSGKGGLYIFHFGTVFTSSIPDGTSYNVGLKINGGIKYGSLQSIKAGSAGSVILKGSWTVSLGAGSYVELLTRQDSGGTANFTGGSVNSHLIPYLSGFRLTK